MRLFFGQTDFDALMVWELNGLDISNRALQRERASQQVQAALTTEQICDRVAAENALPTTRSASVNTKSRLPLLMWTRPPRLYR